jgi:hypothetical protein
MKGVVKYGRRDIGWRCTWPVVEGEAPIHKFLETVRLCTVHAFMAVEHVVTKHVVVELHWLKSNAQILPKVANIGWNGEITLVVNVHLMLILEAGA